MLLFIPCPANHTNRMVPGQHIKMRGRKKVLLTRWDKQGLLPCSTGQKAAPHYSGFVMVRKRSMAWMDPLVARMLLVRTFRLSFSTMG